MMNSVHFAHELEVDCIIPKAQIITHAPMHPCKEVSKIGQISSGANIKCIAYLNKLKASESESTPCQSFARRIQTPTAIELLKISLEIELELYLLFGSSNSRNSLPFASHLVSASKRRRKQSNPDQDQVELDQLEGDFSETSSLRFSLNSSPFFVIFGCLKSYQCRQED
jgi:hypothetical protein